MQRSNHHHGTDWNFIVGHLGPLRWLQPHRLRASALFDRKHTFSAFLALLIPVAAVFLTFILFAEAFLYDAGCGVGMFG